MPLLSAVAQSRADWYGRSPDYLSYYASGFRATSDGGALLAGYQEGISGASKIFSGLVTRLNASGGIANQILFLTQASDGRRTTDSGAVTERHRMRAWSSSD